MSLFMDKKGFNSVLDFEHRLGSGAYDHYPPTLLPQEG